jgi:peptidyl-prolyl cis-trans isomerase-like protein 2
MANKGKNTNSSQFFITYKPTPHLDRKHTIFGRIESGLDILSKMEDVPTDGSSRPLNKILIKDIVVFVDPFEEFQAQKSEKERLDRRQEEIRRQGGTEDDKTTWTGKRLRGDGTFDEADAKQSVGKYLDKEAMGQGQGQASNSGTRRERDDGDADNVDTWDNQPRKKMKSGGGFGNFDSW